MGSEGALLVFTETREQRQMSNEPPNWTPPGGPYGPPGQPAPGRPLAGHYGQPGAFAGTPAKKRRTWLWVLLGLFGFFVVGIGACSALLFTAAKAPIDSANSWIALVDNGDYQGAYDALCQASRDRTTAETVTSGLELDFGAGISDYRLDSYNNSNGLVTVTGSITVAGTSRPITLHMNDESGWRVCDYS